MGLSRDQFMTLPVLEPVERPIPAWGTVRLKQLSAPELLDLREFVRVDTSQLSKEQKRISNLDVMAKVACRCMVDDEDERILQDDEYPLLFKKKGHAVALDAIFDAVSEINGLNRGQTGKNSDPSPSDDSDSD